MAYQGLIQTINNLPLSEIDRASIVDAVDNMSAKDQMKLARVFAEEPERIEEAVAAVHVAKRALTRGGDLQTTLKLHFPNIKFPSK